MRLEGWKDVRLGGCQDGRLGGWDGEWETGGEEWGRREAAGKDGEKEKTKPYTTIPSRGFASGKLPLDRPHQGAVMLQKYSIVILVYTLPQNTP